MTGTVQIHLQPVYGNRMRSGRPYVSLTAIHRGHTNGDEFTGARIRRGDLSHLRGPRRSSGCA